MKHYILHIDTSADVCTVAIACNGVLLTTQQNEGMRNHAAILNVLIDALLMETKLTLQDISAFAVCAGPGSYTGLRIGIATAKGFCYVLDKPLLLQDKLTLLAYQAYHNHTQRYEHYVAILPARENEYYLCVYDADFNCTIAPQHVFENDVAALLSSLHNNILITGEQVNYIAELLKAPQIITHVTNKIDLNRWIFYVFGQYECNNFVNLSTSEPLYLKQVFINK
jgi:tRNA threonylcarbamoyladenosine biosynthesis protein TsaB